MLSLSCGAPTDDRGRVDIAHGVRWHDATTVACELGCELLLEVPPGHVLTDLARENLQGVQAPADAARTFDRPVNLARR
jgi:malonate decarboxylase epsilon subunit